MSRIAALASMANCLNPPATDKMKISAPKQMMAQYGVANFGCSLPRNFGKSPSLAPANNMRGVFNTSALTEPKQDTAAVSSKIVPPTGPTIFSAMAASGASLHAAICEPSIPCVTACSNRYTIRTNTPPQHDPERYSAFWVFYFATYPQCRFKSRKGKK